MKLDLKKTVLLFASIHLLIAWVAERQGKMKVQVTNSRVITAKETAKTKSTIPDKYIGWIQIQSQP